MNLTRPAVHLRGVPKFYSFPIFLCFLAILWNPLSACAFDILLGAGEMGSFSHFAGRTLCRLINSESENLNCEAVSSSDGDVHNLTNLSNDALDICLVDSRMLYDAINKKGNFQFLDITYGNLRLLTPLYGIPITLVVRKEAKISTLDSLKMKRINIGAPLSSQKRAMETIMAAKGWSYQDFSLVQELPSSLSQDTMAFCHGSIQALVHIGVHPDPSLMQTMQLCGAELLHVYDRDVEKWAKTQPAFSKTTLPAGAYPSISREMTTLGTRGMLIASNNLDEGVVHQILTAVFGNRDRLRRAHPSLIPPLESKAIQDEDLLLHSGAVKFFSEHFE